MKSKNKQRSRPQLRAVEIGQPVLALLNNALNPVAVKPNDGREIVRPDSEKLVLYGKGDMELSAYPYADSKHIYFSIKGATVKFSVIGAIWIFRRLAHRLRMFETKDRRWNAGPKRGG